MTAVVSNIPRSAMRQDVLHYFQVGSCDRDRAVVCVRNTSVSPLPTRVDPTRVDLLHTSDTSSRQLLRTYILTQHIAVKVFYTTKSEDAHGTVNGTNA